MYIDPVTLTAARDPCFGVKTPSIICFGYGRRIQIDVMIVIAPVYLNTSIIFEIVRFWRDRSRVST